MLLLLPRTLKQHKNLKFPVKRLIIFIMSSQVGKILTMLILKKHIKITFHQKLQSQMNFSKIKNWQKTRKVISTLIKLVKNSKLTRAVWTDASHLINLKKISGRRLVNCNFNNLNRNMVNMAHKKNENRKINKLLLTILIIVNFH